MGNFKIKLGMKVVQEYLNLVVINFSQSCSSFYCSTQPTVLSRLIELINYNKLNKKVDKCVQNIS